MQHPAGLSTVPPTGAAAPATPPQRAAQNDLNLLVHPVFSSFLFANDTERMARKGGFTKNHPGAYNVPSAILWQGGSLGDHYCRQRRGQCQGSCGGPLGAGALRGGGMLSVRTGFFQLVHFRYWMRRPSGPSSPTGRDRPHGHRRRAISQFRACAPLAATIGTGNIVGGGNGHPQRRAGGGVLDVGHGPPRHDDQLFRKRCWASFTGNKNEEGAWQGGAMYYLADGLGRKKAASPAGPGAGRAACSLLCASVLRHGEHEPDQFHRGEPARRLQGCRNWPPGGGAGRMAAVMHSAAQAGGGGGGAGRAVDGPVLPRRGAGGGGAGPRFCRPGGLPGGRGGLAGCWAAAAVTWGFKRGGLFQQKRVSARRSWCIRPQRHRAGAAGDVRGGCFDGHPCGLHPRPPVSFDVGSEPVDRG